jgi:hypothetical protein
LLGFQLAVVMTEPFASLSRSSKIVHGFALSCIALCTILLMAPAAYHRIVYEGEAAPDFLIVGSRFFWLRPVRLLSAWQLTPMW